VAGAALIACALPSTDEFSSGLDGGDGGSSSGTSSGRDASSSSSSSSSSSGSEAGPSDAENLYANPGFENGSCNGANFFLSTGGTTDDAHSGNVACQTCRKSKSSTNFTFNPYLVVRDPVVGATYRFRVWVKVGEDSFKPQKVRAAIRIANDKPTFEELEVSEGAEVEIDDKWRLFEAAIRVSKKGQELDIIVGSNVEPTDGERCFIVDDIELRRE
jgi:hypothetical protein